MAQLRRLLKEAYDERDTLAKEISSAAREADINENRYRSWERGVLLRRVFSRSFARRKDAHETAQAKCQELDEQLRLTTLATQIEIEREQAEPYYRMRDDFAALSECRKIWDTLDRRAINRVAERSAAHEAVTRELVSFSLSSCDLIQWEQKVPHLPNRTGGDMYIYPGFVLYRASKQAFALIDSREVTLTFRAERFIEVEPVPSDTKVVGHAWSKSNKDGSPDRRFRDNYQIPLVLYGSLTFTCPSGLHEEFQLSSPKLAERFSKAWNVFQASFASTAQERKTTRSVMPFVQTPRNATERLDVTTVFARFKAAQATFVRNVPGGRIRHSEVTAFMLAVLEFIDAVKGQVENSNSSPTVKARFRRAVHGVEAARSHVEECISGGQTNLTESLVAYINSVGSFLNAATESGCQW